MKNNLLTILALGGLLFATSCQMDEPDAGTLTGEVDFTITAGIPGSINTYASNDGGATNVEKETYDQRFILEVYDGDAVAYRAVTTVEIGSNASFDVRLLAKKYTFALWADFVTNGSTEDNLYNTSEGLDAVTIINSNRPAGQEIADAYCYSEEVDLTEGSLSKTFNLKRPFGKIRLISTDKPANDVNSSEGYTPKSVTVTYGTDVMVPTGYNVLTGEASGENAEAGGYTFKPYLEDISAGGTDRGELYILGIDYIIASKSATSVSFDVKVDNNGTRSVTNIPVSANKLTTVIGNFYTNEGSIDVIVEDEFGNGENVEDVPVETTASTLAEAESALEKLAVDPTTGDKDIVIIIPTTPASGDNFNAIEMPELSNNVTIVFEGGISADGLTINDLMASGSAGNDFTGNLTIKNNSTEQQGNLTINLPAGSCKLDGGSYSSVDVTTADNTFVVSEDATIGALTVNKGNVIIYGTVDPDNITIDDGASSKIYWGAGTEDRLREVLAYPAEKNHGAILTADIQSTKLDVNNGAQSNQDGFKIAGSNINSSNEFVTNPYDGYIFDGNGHSISGAAYNNILAVYANNVTVKNLEVYQEDTPAKANAGISIYRVKEVQLSNVDVHNCGKAGVIVNASAVSASNLHTYSNDWGGVNVSKGGAPSGGPKPVFTFDSSCNFEETAKVYVDLDRTGEEFEVNTPGWKSYRLGTKEFYIPADGKNIIPAGTDLSEGGIFAANTAYYLQTGEYSSSIFIDQEGVELIGDNDASAVIVKNSIIVKGNNVAVKNMTVIPTDADGIYTEQSDIIFTVKDVVVDMKNRPSGTAIRVSNASGVILNVEGCNLIIPKSNMRGVNFYSLADGKCELNMNQTHIGPKAEIMGTGYYNDEQNSVFKGLSDTRGIALGDGGTEMVINITNSVVEGIFYAVNIIPAATATVKFNMDNSTLDGRCAFNLWARNENSINEYVVRNSNLVGRNPFGGPTEEFATIVFNFGTGNGFAEPKNNHVIIENSDIYCYNNPETDTNTQYAADMRSWDSNTLELKGNTVIYDRSNSSRLEYAVVVSSDNKCIVDETVQFLDKNGNEKGKPIVKQ